MPDDTNRYHAADDEPQDRHKEDERFAVAGGRDKSGHNRSAGPKNDREQERSPSRQHKTPPDKQPSTFAGPGVIFGQLGMQRTSSRGALVGFSATVIHLAT